MNEEEKKPRRQTCNNHCAACGLHFSGVGAFDAHRVDGECSEVPLEVLSAGEHPHPKLQVWTEEGWCFLMPGAYVDGRKTSDEDAPKKGLTPVTIYQVYVPEGREAFGVTRSAGGAQLVLC